MSVCVSLRQLFLCICGHKIDGAVMTTNSGSGFPDLSLSFSLFFSPVCV